MHKLKTPSGILSIPWCRSYATFLLRFCEISGRQTARRFYCYSNCPWVIYRVLNIRWNIQCSFLCNSLGKPHKYQYHLLSKPRTNNKLPPKPKIFSTIFTSHNAKIKCSETRNKPSIAVQSFLASNKATCSQIKKTIL